MIFPIDLNTRIEEKYPRLFDELQVIEGTEYQILHMYERDIPRGDHALILALAAWRKNKVIFHFDGEVAKEITTQTDPPEKSMPISELKHLPFPSFAVKTGVAISMLDPKTDMHRASFTGNAFVWLDKDLLNTLWEKEDGEFLSACIDLSSSKHTINDLFDDSVMLFLSTAGYSSEDIALLKRLCGVSDFHELTAVTQRHFTRMRVRIGEDAPSVFNRAIEMANLQEILMSRLINIILYLGCENADIENAAEKLKAGAMAGIIKDRDREKNDKEKDGDKYEDRHVTKTEARAVIREIGDSTMLDVGYRIAARWRRQTQTEKGQTDAGEKTKRTGGKRGYSPRRGHWHHFWIGPRNGKIADDIMNPLAGEKGLRRRWLDDTEIHPELKNDQATVIPVE